MKEAKIPSLRGIRTPGVVEANFVKEEEVTQKRIPMRASKIIRRGGDKENLGPFPVDGDLHLNPCDILDFIHGEVYGRLEGIRRNTQMISCAVAIRCRFQHPIDIAAQKVEELPGHHRNFTGINAIRTEDGAATALGTLEEIIKPFFQDFLGKLPGSGVLSENFPGKGEIFSVNGSQKLGPEDGHILRIPGPDKKMTLVRAGAAPHTDIQKELKRPVALQAIFHSF
jgi:hypothetical protein